ncbi:DUF4129 domain-containing protein [Leptolyngbya sp. AN02str]|uniref:DUF4129 domain-containing protein n=1 Tax=Leptolyngbya sp. AN02str TaxID=3423363 RepID=UPI003D322F12
MNAQVNAQDFQRTSPGWQVQQWLQEVGEWVELRFFQNDPNRQPPDLSIPPWLTQTVFWLVVVGVAAWALWQLWQLLAPYWITPWWLQTRSSAMANGASVDDVSVAAWVERSRQAQQQGDYREACRALYMAALRRLSDAELVALQPSRTDGEYLALVQDIGHSRAYQTLITMHEQLWFGATTASRGTAEEYEQCRRAYQELE